MKKRAMKKWIPKNTIYCKTCKWRQYLETRYLHRDPDNFKLAIGAKKCQYADTCGAKCWENANSSCSIEIWKCKYLGLIDIEQDTLLWDGCKECGIHYPKD